MAGERSRRASTSRPTEDADDVVRRGYAAFAATESTHSDGSMSCTVTIYYKTSTVLGTVKRSDRDVPVRLVWPRDTIEGETGTGHGHAEMDALFELFFGICGGNQERIIDTVKRGLAVQCEGKACCLHCSAVLGLLGVLPLTDATTKSPKPMGSTEWSVPPAMRNCLALLTGLPAKTFLGFSGTRRL